MNTAQQRTEFEMSEEQLAQLLEASKPTTAIRGFSTPQENANCAWQHLADELGFVWDTVAPVPGKGRRVFSAVATERAVSEQGRKQQ